MKSHYIVSILFAIIAVIVVQTATQQGVGVSPDSIDYLSAAESIAAGRGAMTITAEGWRPLTHFPPLYPFVASAVPARALDVILFALFVIAACTLAFRGSERSLVAAILTGAVLLTSRDVVVAWCMAWSEPLFFVLLFAFLGVLAKYLDRPETKMLIVAAFLAAAATLTRYAGIAVVATGAIAVVLWSDAPARRRFRDALVFVVVAMLLACAWLARNAMLSGSTTARPPEFHPLPFSTYFVGAENVWRFEIGIDRIPRNLQAIGGALFVAFFVIAGLRQRRRRAVVAPLLALFAIVYLVTFSAIGAFVLLVFDQRLLLPVTITIAILAVMVMVRSPIARVAIIGLIAVHIIVGARAVVSFVADARREGLGYNSLSWKRSPLIARVAQLPPDTSVCSNAGDAIWFLTGRVASALPSKYSPVTTFANPRYEAQLKEGCGDVIVWFSTVPWRTYFPTREELLTLPAVRETAREHDGSLLTPAARLPAARPVP